MSIVSFLKCLTLMVLSLSMKDVKKATAVYKRWETEAVPFLKAHKMLRDFTVISNQFKAEMEFTEGHGEDMAALLKAHLKDFVADNTITHPQIALLKDLALFCRKDSGPAWKRIHTNASELGDNKLAAMFLEDDANDVADMSVVQSMEKIVLALTKRKNDPILSVNEMRDFKEDHEKLITKYSALRKTFKENFQKALLKFVRLSGKPYVDVVRARAYLGAMGCNYLPTGFVGNVDEKGKLLTSAGKPLHGTMFGKMEMNPAYNPKTDDTYYCKLLGGMRGELRTKEMNKRNKTERIADVGDFSDNIETHRKRWLKDLDSLDSETAMAAMITEIVHLTQARIGGAKNENDGKPTYGITTLRAKHVRVTAQGIAMRYPGKKGTPQHHVIRPDSASNRKIIKLFKGDLEGKTGIEFVFTLDSKPIRAGIVNKYLRSIGVSVTIHKFRHAAATHEAKKMLASCPFNSKNVPSQAQAERWIKTEAIKIGTLLHHRTGSGDKQKTTSSTAIAAYISPDILKNWFLDLGLRVPKWIPDFEDD